MHFANKLILRQRNASRVPRATLIPALVVLGAVIISLALPVTAQAQAWLRDRVQGETYVVNWSPGEWKQNGTPLPACTTFPGGTWTGPGQTTDVDSLICDVTPTSWNWTVTVPGPYVIQWGIQNFPPGIEVCAQIFYLANKGGTLFVDLDVERDWMVVRGEEGEIHYQGSYSGFFPIREGFVLTEARRCGLIRVLPTGACCYPDGTCVVAAQHLCTGEWLGPDTDCDPNPCPQPPPLGACCFVDGSCIVLTEAECAGQQGDWLGPDTGCDPNPCPIVPVETSSWGRIKAVYR